MAKWLNLKDAGGMRFLIFGGLLVVLAIYTFVTTGNLQKENQRQTDCLLTYIGTSSQTSKIRSVQNEKETEANKQESEATRLVIQTFFTGKIKTPEQFFDLGVKYNRKLNSVDEQLDSVAQARKANPITVFDPAQCGIKGRAKTKKDAK